MSEEINNTQTISDIIRGMQHAVNTAQETLQEYQFQLLKKYFDPETGKPIECYVTLKDGRRVDVPIITLIPSNNLALDELEMDFSVRVASQTVKNFQETLPAGSDTDSQGNKYTRSAFNVFFSGLRRDKTKDKDASEKNATDRRDTDIIDIHMKFKAVEEPEAAARIREMLNNQVQ